MYVKFSFCLNSYTNLFLVVEWPVKASFIEINQDIFVFLNAISFKNAEGFVVKLLCQ